MITLTATLTWRVQRDIHSKLYFPKTGSLFRNEGNDRPNVSIVVRTCEHPLNSYTDLNFVIPASINKAEDIPKTYLYVDNINEGSEIIDHLARLIEKRHNRPASIRPNTNSCVRPFNATLSLEYRTKAMHQFCAGKIHLLVCTDAAGMVCSTYSLVVSWVLIILDRVVTYRISTPSSNGNYRQLSLVSSSVPGAPLRGQELKDLQYY